MRHVIGVKAGEFHSEHHLIIVDLIVNVILTAVK